MYYAQLENNIVIGITQSSSEINNPNNILIDFFDVGLIGKTYSNGTFIDVPIIPTLQQYCTILEFRSKFTTTEKVAIYTAADSNVLIKIWLDDLNAVQNNVVDLSDARTIEGVQGLEAAGLIGTGRAAEILQWQ